LSIASITPLAVLTPIALLIVVWSPTSLMALLSARIHPPLVESPSPSQSLEITIPLLQSSSFESPLIWLRWTSSYPLELSSQVLLLPALSIQQIVLIHPLLLSPLSHEAIWLSHHSRCRNLDEGFG
jgi:hypothetical protein